jgi:NhaP-type Na+/H+ and K+/H+ antiporter
MTWHEFPTRTSAALLLPLLAQQLGLGLLAGVPGAWRLFSVAFLVMLSLLIQGSTLERAFKLVRP